MMDVMDLTRLRLIIADGRYAIDPLAVADALLRVPGIAPLITAQRPAPA